MSNVIHNSKGKNNEALSQEQDQIIKLGKSLIHSGPQSRRVFLLRYHREDHDRILADLIDRARKNGYDKVIAKIPGNACEDFLQAGFQEEARILDYYPDGETCYFVSCFLSEARQTNELSEKHRDIVQTAAARPQKPIRALSPDYTLNRLYPEHAEEMAALYDQVFETYPFPIFDPAYIRQTMATHVVYYGVFHKSKLIALASAETDSEYGNAEMTDFAILPDHRGLQLARHLLNAMEAHMINDGMRTLYTIARAASLPMNCTFGGSGYTYGGTLVNNTQISGQIESMNIWAKSLAADAVE